MKVKEKAFAYGPTNERIELVTAECDEIRRKYHFGRVKINAIAKLYYNNEALKTGNIIRSIDCISKTLSSYGFTEEEIYNYYIKNGRVYLANYNNLLIKLSILNKCNLLEDGIFKNSYILNYDSTKNGITKEFMYAIAKSKNFDLDISDFTQSMTTEAKRQLIAKNMLTKEEAINLINEFKITLKENREASVQPTLK